jgi:hypothetical protein
MENAGGNEERKEKKRKFYLEDLGDWRRWEGDTEVDINKEGARFCWFKTGSSDGLF